MTRTTISYDRKSGKIIETKVEEVPGELDIMPFCKFMVDSYKKHIGEIKVAN